MAFSDDLYSLFSPINKVNLGEENDEGVVTPLLPELELSMTDEELIALKRRWESAWKKLEPEISPIQKRNEEYWLGKQSFDQSFYGSQRPTVDNLIFESTETFLPIANRKNPEPIVEAGEDEAGKALASDIRKQLIYLSDILNLKLKVKKGARYWALYRLAVWKLGWSQIDNEMDIVAIRPQKLVLDPQGTFDESGNFNGEFIGEYMDDLAEVLIRRFPDQKDFITNEVSGNLGSHVKYMQWSTDNYTFFTLKNEVLGKFNNPHWVYDGEEDVTDEFGNVSKQVKRGSNHFNTPRKAYVGLTIFSLGLKPFDDTGLIDQNIPLQDMITKRMAQIDRNADNTNAGNRISGDHFTQEEAGRADKALREGKSIWVPRGDVNTAVSRDQAPALPQFVYESLQDYRNELRNIYGVRGSSAQGIAAQDTARGKILAQQSDDSRIGGGITEYIEQVYDSLFNWMVQMMYVYYDEPHVASIMGEAGAFEYSSLRRDQLQNRKLLISVKEGSLIPEDPLTRRNEAMDLWNAKAIDPINFYKRLGDANPMESAQSLYLWMTNPAALFPGLQQPMPPGMPGVPAPQPPVPGQPSDPGMPPQPQQAPEQQGQALLNSVPVQ